MLAWPLHHRGHPTWLLIVLFGVALSVEFSSRTVAGAPADEYDKDQLEAMLQIGLQDLDSYQDRCASENVAINLEAAKALARAADMIALAALRFPFPPDAEHERTERLRWAASGRERAYNCHPGWEQRHYLKEALALVTRRLTPTTDDHFGPLPQKDRDELTNDQARIDARIAQIKAPTCIPEEECGKPSEREVQSTSRDEDLRGYRARWMDRLSLGLEFGGGGGVIRFRDAGRAQMPLFTVGVAPGVRVVAGAKRRAVFLAGFHYGLYRIRSDGQVNTAHSVVARLGAGIRVHPRWFSAHATFEIGVGLVTGDASFGGGLVGGSAALCTWGEALCASIRLQSMTNSTVYFNPIVGLVGVDVFRIIDNALRRETPS